MTDSISNLEVSTADADADLAAESRGGGIVVGIDGSAGSLRALRWAVQEAQLRGLKVRAIMAWEQPVAYGSSTMWSLGVDPSAESKEDLALAARIEVSRLEGESGPVDDIAISYEALEGHPAEVLLLAAQDAELLVVGSRGHGGFVGALLGSVSQHVVQHARCPVTVIPTSAELG